MNDERILVVEDTELLLDALKVQMEAQGYQVTGVTSVSQALHVTQTQTPDLMILDLTLLDDDPFAGLTDGFAFLRLLRRNHPEADFPVIIHTGDPSPEVETRAKANGVFAVIRKGIPTSELVGIVRLALDEWQGRQASPAVLLPDQR
jgi:two-component system, OmpR family, alkaline phosphatase synthesis response regulator PhoP